jgi:sterol desaturase/sphingolipid hydroxylase (fatty acid hydroxylase superfamily)
MDILLTSALQTASGYFQALGGRLRSWEFIFTLCFVLVFLAADIYRKGWRGHWLRNHLDSICTTLLLSAISLFFLPFFLIIVDGLQFAYASLGIPSIPKTFWDGWPVVLQVLLFLLALDFIDYWNHRLMHTQWVWPIHAIHHSDSDVNGFTTLRVHSLEAVLMKGTHIFFLSWLGFSHIATGSVIIFMTVLNAYVHANVDWHHGRLHLLLASPRFHRWHHADDPAARGKNLANIFPFYDWIFGTHYNPGPCTAPMGSPGVPDKNAWQLYLFPFVEITRQIRDGMKSHAPKHKSSHGGHA